MHEQEINDPFIQRAIIAFRKKEIVNSIFQAVSLNYGNTVYLGFPVIASEKNKIIYFIIDTENYDQIPLKMKIKEILGFDYAVDDVDDQDVIILNSKLIEPNKMAFLVKDLTVFSPDNFSEIQNFLDRNYKAFFEKTNSIFQKEDPNASKNTDYEQQSAVKNTNAESSIPQLPKSSKTNF